MFVGTEICSARTPRPTKLAGRRRVSAAKRGDSAKHHVSRYLPRPAPTEDRRTGTRQQSRLADRRCQYRGGTRAIPHSTRRVAAGGRRRRDLHPQRRGHWSNVERRLYGQRRRTRQFLDQSGHHRLRDRPVRARPFAQHGGAKPLFQHRSRRACHPADAGRRYRNRVADLCLRPELAQDRAGHRRQRRDAA